MKARAVFSPGLQPIILLHVFRVTGSSGRLGEALMRSLPARGHKVRGIGITPSPFAHPVHSTTEGTETTIGKEDYRDQVFTGGPYPVEPA